MSSNIGNNDSMAQGAENSSGVRGRRGRLGYRQANYVRTRLSPELRMVIPRWLHHRVRDEAAVGTSNVFQGVEEVRVKPRLETIEE